MAAFSTKYVILFIALATHSFSQENPPTVEVLNGILSGTHELSYNGRVFSAFRGVPYAESPVGNLRFQPPQIKSNWTGILRANQEILCLQVYNFIDRMEILGEEDCLHLNIYVPREIPSVSDQLDVVFDIHGGSFMLGSGVFYAGPSFLMDREVILVTINYRLGPFGFLSTEDDVLPGNDGLKDQVFALQWVHDNIAFFGGNPDSITLTGFSAGGASVHHHYFSPLSKGLFRRGLSISGNALNPWALQKAALQKAKTLAGYVDCDSESSPEIVECLRGRPALSIIENVKKFFHYNVIPFAVFGPVVERNNAGAFLIDHPYNLLQSGEINDVPWITSFARNDGVFPTAYFHERIPYVDENWENISAILLDYEHTVSPHDLPDIAETIRQFYFGETPLTLDALIEVNTHRHFAVNMERSIRAQAKLGGSPVYAYVFGYRGQHSFSEIYSQTTIDMGVAHGDDVQYIFQTNPALSRLTEEDEQMKNVFLDLIASYASEGVPRVEGATWEPVDADDTTVKYLDIRGPEDIYLATVEDLTPRAFWDSLPLKENQNAQNVELAQ